MIQIAQLRGTYIQEVLLRGVVPHFEGKSTRLRHAEVRSVRREQNREECVKITLSAMYMRPSCSRLYVEPFYLLIKQGT